ncbi:hypothetical protein SBP28_001971 [Candidozyma auris]|nr:hypothetical protein CJJ09_002037 [[Candida] auris]
MPEVVNNDLLPMGLFSFSGSQQGIKIPTFELSPQPDSIDLRIRSLLYLFKALRINKLAAFPHADGSLKYIESDGDTEDPARSIKLDKLYNLSHFVNLLTSEPQRVLVDYPKNKFRAYCILSDLPSANLSRPSSPTKSRSEKSSLEFENGYPVFVDYRGKRATNFAFSLLQTGQQVSLRELATILANSLVYVEHHSYVPFSARLNTAKKSIQSVSRANLTDESCCELTDTFKYTVVFRYLKDLAFLVQLLRIYDEYMKKTPKSPTASPSLSSSSRSSPQLSPGKKTATLSSKKSTSCLVGGERSLKAKPSISNFRANEIYNPVTSPQKKSSKTPSSSTPDEIYGREIVQDVWDKCKASIRLKLEREMRTIEKTGLNR